MTPGGQVGAGVRSGSGGQGLDEGGGQVRVDARGDGGGRVGGGGEGRVGHLRTAHTGEGAGGNAGARSFACSAAVFE